MIEEKDVKLEMISAASLALDYLNQHPNADIEEVIRHVVKNIKAEEDVKIAGIAAANHVLKYKEKNPKSTEKQLMQSLANSTNEILESIQKQDETISDKIEKKE